jgi:hypothetical protein
VSCAVSPLRSAHPSPRQVRPRSCRPPSFRRTIRCRTRMAARRQLRAPKRPEQHQRRPLTSQRLLTHSNCGHWAAGRTQPRSFGRLWGCFRLVLRAATGAAAPSAGVVTVAKLYSVDGGIVVRGMGLFANAARFTMILFIFLCRQTGSCCGVCLLRLREQATRHWPLSVSSRVTSLHFILLSPNISLLLLLTSVMLPELID